MLDARHVLPPRRNFQGPSFQRGAREPSVVALVKAYVSEHRQAMSIELTAEIADVEGCRSAIADALEGDPNVQRLPSADARIIKLRLRENPAREHWPEDVELLFGPTRLVVIIHSASRQQREYLVDLLERTLSGVGCAAELVEE
jgi:hypothetical protein